jgi:hypothetical protein
MPTRTVPIILAALLIFTNGYWLYHTIDNGIRQTYQKVSSDNAYEELRQVRAIMAVTLKGEVSRDAVISAATKAANNSAPFEKNGFTWVGQLGLKFNDAGKLIALANEGDY